MRARVLTAVLLLCTTRPLWPTFEPAPAIPPTRWVHFSGRTPATTPEMYTRPAREPDGSGHAGGLNEDFVVLTLRDSNGAPNGPAPPGKSISESAEFTVHVAFDSDSTLTWPEDYRLYEDSGTGSSPNRLELLPLNGVFTKTVPALPVDAGGLVVRRRLFVVFQEDDEPEPLGTLVMRIIAVDAPGPWRVDVGWNSSVRWLVEDDDGGVTLAGWKGGE